MAMEQLAQRGPETRAKTGGRIRAVSSLGLTWPGILAAKHDPRSSAAERPA